MLENVYSIKYGRTSRLRPREYLIDKLLTADTDKRPFECDTDTDEEEKNLRITALDVEAAVQVKPWLVPSGWLDLLEDWPRRD